jgi:PAS domain S-box-containing protein
MTAKDSPAQSPRSASIVPGLTGGGMSDFIPVLATGIALLLILGGLYLISQMNYLLFHGITEIAAIAVAIAIFMLVWNTRKVYSDSFFILLGISLLFIAGFDLIHTLAFKGMGVFPGDNADIPTQLWIAARYFQSVTFFIATLLIGRSITKGGKHDASIIFAGCAAASGLLLSSIFVWQNFPHAFVEGSGLTPFKIGSEYVISLILVATIVVLYLKRDHFDSTVWRLLIAAQVFLIAGELAFTSYISVYGFMNMLGHLFRLLSVYFLYRAIVVVGLTRPYDLLLRKLKLDEDALKKSEAETRAILTAAKESIYLFSAEGTILQLNETAARRLGDRTPGEVTGHQFSEFMSSDLARSRRAWLDEVIRSGTPVQFEDERGGIIFDHTFYPVPDNTGTVTRIAVFSRDITARKKAEEALREKNEELQALNEELTAVQEELQQNIVVLSEHENELSKNEEKLKNALAEKEVLLAEIHHRVKNNLTAFISLLSLEGSTEDTPAGKMLRQDLQNRARSMALIHETLYRTHKYDEVDMGLYLTTLVGQIADSFRTTRTVKTNVDAQGVMLDIPRATPAGLIINELVTNSFKYAFPPFFDSLVVRNAPPVITVSFAKHGTGYVMSVRDNGIGLPPGLNITKSQTLGLKLVNFLAKHQLRANVEVRTEKGTEFIFRMNQ